MTIWRLRPEPRQTAGPGQEGEKRLTDHDQEQFVTLIAQYQRRLQAYVRSLVPDRTDAEEVLQEVNLFLWRQQKDYRPGTDFGAWAYKVAYYHVLTYRKKVAREKLRFSDELVGQLAESSAAVAAQADHREVALEQCLKKLPEKDRLLVHLRYQGSASVRDLARRLRRSAKAIYRALDRVHLALLDCIRRRLKAEEGI